jgi:hypothetical protein
MWAIAGNPLVSFSEQQVLNCLEISDPYYGTYKPGCGGGFMDMVYEYAMK